MGEDERATVGWWPSGTELSKKLQDEIGERDWACFTVDTDGRPGDPYQVLMSVGRSPDGRLICTGLMLGNLAPIDRWPDVPVEITARSLRDVVISDLLAKAVQTAQVSGTYGEAVARLLAGAQVIDAPRTRPGPRGYPDEYFEYVAGVYRRAQIEMPGSPMKWVQQQLHVSDATARRQVQRARDLGFLGASQPGKSGEAPQPATRKRAKR